MYKPYIVDAGTLKSFGPKKYATVEEADQAIDTYVLNNRNTHFRIEHQYCIQYYTGLYKATIVKLKSYL